MSSHLANLWASLSCAPALNPAWSHPPQTRALREAGTSSFPRRIQDTSNPQAGLQKEFPWGFSPSCRPCPGHRYNRSLLSGTATFLQALTCYISRCRPLTATKACLKPGPGSVVSGESATGNGLLVDGHGGPPYADSENEALRRVGHCADQRDSKETTPPGPGPHLLCIIHRSFSLRL